MSATYPPRTLLLNISHQAPPPYYVLRFSIDHRDIGTHWLYVNRIDIYCATTVSRKHKLKEQYYRGNCRRLYAILRYLLPNDLPSELSTKYDSRTC